MHCEVKNIILHAPIEAELAIDMWQQMAVKIDFYSQCRDDAREGGMRSCSFAYNKGDEPSKPLNS